MMASPRLEEYAAFEFGGDTNFAMVFSLVFLSELDRDKGGGKIERTMNKCRACCGIGFF
jgi:hypothetical protein